VTNEEAPAGPVRRGLRTGRLEAFSDGVFAITITLLVLDIALPAGASSFSTIESIWLGHNAITEYLDRVDATFVRLNLLLLLFVSFLPFPTRLFADYIGHDNLERVAGTFYGITLLLCSALLLALWRYAVRKGLVRPDADDEEIELLTQRLTPGLAGYLVLIVAGLFVPMVAVIGYLAVALFFIIPTRHLTNLIRSKLHRSRSA
jgi:uncharacterized membrane protein